MNSIILHRALQGHEAGFADHFQLAVSAAFELTDQLFLAAQYDFGNLVAEHLFLVFTAAIALLVVLREQDDPQRERATAAFDACIEWLHTADNAWPAARATMRLLQAGE